jgi:hypothetical protein
MQDKVVALIQTPGSPPMAGLDVDQPGFQLRVRGASIGDSTSAYTDAEAKAVQIVNDLHSITPGSLSGRHYPGIYAVQSPFLLEYDDSMRPHMVCNFRAFRSRTT